ncbi:hypothetical protein L1987_06920 [Smallanthus sonchifolius]|uniref:Uncharacterized protein n=1 Tax=Smallanthus sonchifolius TaxID=185202 RepID=A0ACB9JZG6_9ASTR|nr:hypothetical protein L1987_06920 [Smallanthus sonchifolius]
MDREDDDEVGGDNGGETGGDGDTGGDSGEAGGDGGDSGKTGGDGGTGGDGDTGGDSGEAGGNGGDSESDDDESVSVADSEEPPPEFEIDETDERIKYETVDGQNTLRGYLICENLGVNPNSGGVDGSSSGTTDMMIIL